MKTSIELTNGHWLLVVGSQMIAPTLLTMMARLAEKVAACSPSGVLTCTGEYGRRNHRPTEVPKEHREVVAREWRLLLRGRYETILESGRGYASAEDERKIGSIVGTEEAILRNLPVYLDNRTSVLYNMGRRFLWKKNC